MATKVDENADLHYALELAVRFDRSIRYAVTEEKEKKETRTPTGTLSHNRIFPSRRRRLTLI